MDSPSTPLSETNLSFALALLNKLSPDDVSKNVFFSPFSIFSALTQVLRGAKGSTHEQMSKVLGVSKVPEPQPDQMEGPEKPEQPEGPEGPEGAEQQMQMEQERMPLRTQMQSAYQSQMQTRMQLRMQLTQTQQTRLPAYLRQCLKPQTDDENNIHAKVAKVMKELNKKNAPYALSVANRLYGEQTYEFLKDFLEDIKRHYGAGLESVDFKTKAEEARVTINGWVEEKTQGKIKDMLTAGVLDDSTRLVLVNAIYFKGLWEHKFKMEFTEDDQFRINKNDTKPVKMMRQKREFSHRIIPEINIKVLEMPYKSGELSMIILLPNDIEDDTTGLENLEKELTPMNFVAWTCPEMMINDEVDVKLPRFKMEEKYDLNSVLKEMGMSDAFDISRSDFSGMSSANDLFLSKVLHGAQVEVTEQGTEAAAATGVVLANRSASMTVNFFADHPFLFFIRHNPSKTILFSGRFCSPE